MTEPIKVLYLLHDSRRSGVPAVAVNLIKALDPSVVRAKVLFAYDGVYADDLREAGIEVDAFSKRRPLLWRLNRFLFNLRLIGMASQVDVVHLHSTKLAFSVLVAKWLKMRVVYHLHELPQKPGLLLRLAMKATDCVVFCSRTCEEHFAWVPAVRKRTIVNAISAGSAPPAVHAGRGRKIVMAASINKNKGQDLLLRAFTRMRDKDAELWLYGTTGLSAHTYVHDLKRFAGEEGVAQRVYFPGPTSQALAVFAGADVVVHTSWTESFGMALVEAMSCGVPVVAHDLEGMKEVVVDGVTGFLVPPGDIDALAARLDELLENPELRARMGLAAYRSVRERFDVRERVEEYVRLYREICGSA